MLQDSQDSAVLIEAVAGAGKSTYLARLAKQKAAQGQSVLMLSFSNSGAQVLERYLTKMKANTDDHIRVITIEQLAQNLLQLWGTNAYHLPNERILDEILPDLLENILTTTEAEWLEDCPRLTVKNCDRLKQDLDLYRYSQSYLLNDIEDISVEFHFSKRLTVHLFTEYERLRHTWQDMITPISGKYGFRTAAEICYDFLELAQYEVGLPAFWCFDCILIDEFHDLSPLHLAVLKKLVQLMEVSQQTRLKIVAVGDRYQNLYEWRDGSFDWVFDEFIRYFSAQVQYLRGSYRFGSSLANAVSKLTKYEIKSLVEHDTRIQYCDQLPANLINHSVLITTDMPNLIRLAFALLSKHIPVSFEFANEELAYFFSGLLSCEDGEAMQAWLSQIMPYHEAQLILESVQKGLLLDVLGALRHVEIITGASRDRAFLIGLYEYVQKHYPLLPIQSWPELYAYLNQQAKVQTKYYLYTVAHAKGKEFNRVILCPPYEGQSRYSDRHLLHLQYVAVTRTKKELILVRNEVRA